MNKNNAITNFIAVTKSILHGYIIVFEHYQKSQLNQSINSSLLRHGRTQAHNLHK